MVRVIQVAGALALFSLSSINLWSQQHAVLTQVVDEEGRRHDDGSPPTIIRNHNVVLSSSLPPVRTSAATMATIHNTKESTVHVVASLPATTTNTTRKQKSTSTIPIRVVRRRSKGKEEEGNNIGKGNGLGISTTGNSQHAAVIGVATGYHTRTEFRPFVTSLRRTNYSGAIILGVDENIPQRVVTFLKAHNVTMKPIHLTKNCTFAPFYQTPQEMEEETDEETFMSLTTCAKSHPHLKLRWLKYSAALEWLRDCPQCTGPVLFTDVRDVFFQGDPFGGPDQGHGGPNNSKVITGLEVFEEHPNVTTEHWLVNWPLTKCKGMGLQRKPMLCSGSTIGNREAMMTYLDTMYQEMKQWMADPKCRIKLSGGDQAIHNYLFYTGKLSDAKAYHNREGTVHTVGYEIDAIREQNLERLQKEQGVTRDQAKKLPLLGANERTWISKEKYRLTDDFGFFTNLDGSRSRVVHQWDRAKSTIEKWMEQQGLS